MPNEQTTSPTFRQVRTRGDLARQKAAFDADEAERAAVRFGTSTIGDGVVDEVAAGEAQAIGDELTSGGNIPFRLDPSETIGYAVEKLAGEALRVTEIREQLLGEHYPFRRDRAGLQLSRGQQRTFYEYCLAVGFAASRPDAEHQRYVRRFEALAKDLLTAFICGRAIGVRFGSPSLKDETEFQGGSFTRKVEWMKRSCGFHNDEWLMQNNESLRPTREQAKDARIDIVVRRDFGDKRPGGFTLIAQCGCGRNDVDDSTTKHEMMSKGWLNTIFSQRSNPEPYHVFITSQHVVDPKTLYTRQSVGGCLFIDRPRLVLLAAEHPHILETHRKYINECCSSIYK